MLRKTKDKTNSWEMVPRFSELKTPQKVCQKDKGRNKKELLGAPGGWIEAQQCIHKSISGRGGAHEQESNVPGQHG